MAMELGICCVALGVESCGKERRGAATELVYYISLLHHVPFIRLG